MIENNSETLFSATAASSLESILKEGLRRGSYWTNDDDVSAYYAETIEDEGMSPVIIQVSLSALSAEYCRPDHNGLVEPLTYTLGKSQEDVALAWESSEKKWEDSMEIIHSIRYHAVVPADALYVEIADGGSVSLFDYVKNV